jgi:DNA-binding PadR family transcriptional regulator
MDENKREDKKQSVSTLWEKTETTRHRSNWPRQNAMVPKGFLRYHVLKALKEQPMSGSELTERIQKYTGGTWKPSPGSIYPLLSWLQSNEYIREIPTAYGLKRYELTMSCYGLLDEQRKIREKFFKNAEFLAGLFFDRLRSNLPEEKANEVRVSMIQLNSSFMGLIKTMREVCSEQEINEVLKVFDETSRKLEEIKERIDCERAKTKTKSELLSY